MSDEKRPLKVEVTNNVTVHGKISFVVYIIRVTYDDNTAWELGRRFSEFVTLRNKFASHVSINITSLPQLPKTVPFIGSDLAPSFVSERKLRLQRFLDECLRSPGIRCLEEFANFIGIADKPERKTGNLPSTPETYHFASEFVNYLQPMLGVKQFHYDSKAMHCLTACSDTSQLSKLDSWLTNVKLPWEQETNTIVPVGCVASWVFSAETGTWSMADVLYYEVGVHCIQSLGISLYTYIYI